MSDVQSQSNQTPENQTQDKTLADVNAGLDVAALAAEQMAQAAGLKNADQLAATVSALLSRVQALESVLPQLTESYTAIQTAYEDLSESKVGAEVVGKLEAFVKYGEQVLGFRHTQPVPVVTPKV